jgi:hypothetical protein
VLAKEYNIGVHHIGFGSVYENWATLQLELCNVPIEPGRPDKDKILEVAGNAI